MLEVFSFRGFSGWEDRFFVFFFVSAGFVGFGRGVVFVDMLLVGRFSFKFLLLRLYFRIFAWGAFFIVVEFVFFFGDCRDVGVFIFDLEIGVF